MQKLFFLFIAFLINHVEVYSQTEVSNSQEYSILFIGNSLTATHELPKLVKKYAKQKGIKIKTKMVAIPNYAIEDHWNDGEVQKIITSNKYNYVILQQGPSSQSEGRQMLIDYGKKYKSLCSIHNAKLCFLMVWPALKYYPTFEGVIKNYSDAATINNSILLPVGIVWKEQFDTTKNFDYYGPDGFHPSEKGSEITAKIIVDYLFH